MMAKKQAGRPCDASYALTERQREVVDLLAKGFTNTEIAELLGCAPGTVKLHVSAIIERLEVTNRTEAAAVWLATRPVQGGDAPDDARRFALIVDVNGTSGAYQPLLATFEAILVQRGHSVRRVKSPRDAGNCLLVSLAVMANEGIVTLDARAVESGGDYPIAHITHARPAIEMDTLAVELAADVLALVTPPPEDVRPGEVEADLGELYWRGRNLVSQMTPETLRAGLDYLALVLASEPQNVPALVASALGTNQLAAFAGGGATELYAMGRQAAEAAVALEPTLAEAHAALGYCHLFGDWDLPAAARSLHRAHVLDPAYEETLINLSLLHMIRGEMDDALSYAVAGWRLNRDHIPNYVHLGHVYRERGEPETALKHLTIANEMDAANGQALLWTSLCLADLGDFAGARALAEGAAKAAPDAPLLLGLCGYLAGCAGDREACSRWLHAVRQCAHLPSHSPLFEALCHIGAGRRDDAMAAIRQSLPQRMPFLLGWRCDPVFARLRDHPDFAAVGRAIGI